MFKKRIFKILSGVALTLVGTQVIENVTAEASTNGRVSWDLSNQRAVSGVKNGKPYSHSLTPLFVNGKDAFCLEPGVEITAYDYVGNPANGNLPRETVLAMALWKDVLGSDVNSKLVAGTVVWGSLSGSNKFTVNSMGGFSDSDLKAKQNKLKEAIVNYDKKPSFNAKTIELKYGVTTEIKNTTAGVDLRQFDTLVGNTAGVSYEVTKDSIKVTPTDKTKKTGTIAFKKSFMEGTPYIWRQSGSQTLGTGAIDDPNNFLLKFNIQTTGNVKIQKVDEETGKPLPNFKFKVDFEGTNAPKSQEIVTGTDGTYEFKDLEAGTKVTATEIGAKAPYILQSAVGKKDVVSGVVELDKTITLTQKNPKAKGQILIEKTGAESKLDMWNSNYTLAGNTFEIRKDTEDGAVVKTVTTNDLGKAETTKDLDLGPYYVVEVNSSNGFAKSFKPVKVELTYENQTVPVVFSTAKGENQEVTGNTILQKVDSETGKETQGKAKFEGAEYTLYHADGSNADKPVKWNATFKPVLSVGKKVDNENIVLEVDSKSIQVGVNHLALGRYYWLESKAPEGYQKDLSKHYFDLKYAGQDEKVVISNSESKENVIKLNFEAFKYVTSQNGSAQTGHNDIDFTLTPDKETTKGEVRKATTKTKDGLDGFLEFKEYPYGDYVLEEDEAPEGFKKIKPLHIKSSFDIVNRVYIFTVTEKGQTAPLKTIKVPEDKINNGSNIIQISRFSLFDDSVEVPELETTLTDNTGKKMIDYGQTVKLKDVVKYSEFDNSVDEEITFNGVLTNNGKPVLVDGKEITGTTKVPIKKAKGSVTVNFEFDSSKIDISKVQKLTSFITAVDSKGKVIQVHNDPESEEQTVEFNVPSIDTLATYQNDDKESFPSLKAKVVDKVSYENLGKGNYEVVTKALDKTTNKFIADVTTTQKVLDTSGQWTIKLDLNTMDSIGHDIVFYQYVYADKGKTKLVAKHEDKESTDQTIKVLIPEVKTLATFNEADKDTYPSNNSKTKDLISYKNFAKGEYYVVTKAVNKSNGNVIFEKDTTQKVTDEFGVGEWSVTQDVNTLDLIGQDIVFYEYVYADKEKTKLVAKHEDKEDKDQTIKVLVPEITTLATFKDGKKDTFPKAKDLAVDNVAYKNLGNGEFYVVTKAVNKANGEVIKEKETVQTNKDSNGTGSWSIEQEFNTFELTGQEIVFYEYVYADKEKTKLIAKHEDITSEDQTIKVLTPEVKTLATYKNGEKELFPSSDTKAVDKVSYGNFSAGEYVVVTKAVNTTTDQILFEKESTQVVAEDTGKGDWNIEQEFNTLDSIGQEIVFYEYVYADKEKTILVAKHEDKEDKDQTIKVTVPSIKTEATFKDGKKESYPRESEKAVDNVSFENLGNGEFYVVTKVVDKANEKVIAESESVQTNDDSVGAGTWSIEQELNTLELMGHDVVFYQYVYRDKEHKTLIAKHEDINSEEQTIKVLVPKIETKATFKDGEKQAYPNDKEKAVDVVSYENFAEGKYHVVTKIVDKGKVEKKEETKDSTENTKVSSTKESETKDSTENTKVSSTKESETKDSTENSTTESSVVPESKEEETVDISKYKVIAESESEQEIKANYSKDLLKVNQDSSWSKGEWKIEQELTTEELAGHEIVFFQYVYADKEKTKLVAKHEDINATDQTLEVLTKDTPKIETLAHTGDGKTQVAKPNKETKMYDKINISNLTVGDSYTYKLKLNRIETKDGKENVTVVYEDSFDFKADKKELEKEINTTVNTEKDTNDVRYVFTEQLFDSKDKLVADHSDLKNTKETITIKTDEEVLTKKDLPKAGEILKKGAVFFGLMSAIGLGLFYYLNNRRVVESSSTDNGIDRFN